MAVNVGAEPQAHLIVLNRAAIVLTTQPCNMLIINGWLLVQLEIANVISGPDACQLTMGILFTEQFIVTVWEPVAGVYVLPTSSCQANVALAVMVHQANGKQTQDLI